MVQPYKLLEKIRPREGRSQVFFFVTLTSKCQLGKCCCSLVTMVSVVSSHLLVLESDAIVMSTKAHTKEREEDRQTSETTNPNQFWLVVDIMNCGGEGEYWQKPLQFSRGSYARPNWNARNYGLNVLVTR